MNQLLLIDYTVNTCCSPFLHLVCTQCKNTQEGGIRPAAHKKYFLCVLFTKPKIEHKYVFLIILPFNNSELKWHSVVVFRIAIFL